MGSLCWPFSTNAKLRLIRHRSLRLSRLAEVPDEAVKEDQETRVSPGEEDRVTPSTEAPDTPPSLLTAVVTTIIGLATKVGTVYHHSPVLGRTAVPGDLKETKTSEKLTSTAETTNTNSSTTQCIQVVHTKITEIHILKFLN